MQRHCGVGAVASAQPAQSVYEVAVAPATVSQHSMDVGVVVLVQVGENDEGVMVFGRVAEVRVVAAERRRKEGVYMVLEWGWIFRRDCFLLSKKKVCRMCCLVERDLEEGRRRRWVSFFSPECPFSMFGIQSQISLSLSLYSVIME